MEGNNFYFDDFSLRCILNAVGRDTSDGQTERERESSTYSDEQSRWLPSEVHFSEGIEGRPGTNLQIDRSNAQWCQGIAYITDLARWKRRFRLKLQMCSLQCVFILSGERPEREKEQGSELHWI